MVSINGSLLDEYMESVVARLSQNTLDSVEEIIQCIYELPKAEMNGKKATPIRMQIPQLK